MSNGPSGWFFVTVVMRISFSASASRFISAAVAASTALYIGKSELARSRALIASSKSCVPSASKTYGRLIFLEKSACENSEL